MTTHALLTPWPISSGLHTYCGIRADDERVRGHKVANSPELVDCERCRDAMRTAYDNLSRWVPKLVADGEG